MMMALSDHGLKLNKMRDSAGCQNQINKRQGKTIFLSHNKTNVIKGLIQKHNCVSISAYWAFHQPILQSEPA